MIALFWLLVLGCVVYISYTLLNEKVKIEEKQNDIRNAIIEKKLEEMDEEIRAIINGESKG